MNDSGADALPKNYGVVLFPSFQPLDAFGPLDALSFLARKFQINLYVIAESMEGVSTAPVPAENPQGSRVGQTVLPTHTFASAPDDLEVLLVPGGLGTRSPGLDTKPVEEFIARTYPKLKYLITVCTGVGLAARAGVLDGKRATGNKAQWAWCTAQGPNVKWMSHARWVSDGNIWTTAGVQAGQDGFLALIAHIYGEETADSIARGEEYVREKDWRKDPWAEYYQLPRTEHD